MTRKIEHPGDAAAVGTLASTLLQVSATFDDLDTFSTNQSVPDGWSGQAADAYSRHVRQVATDADSTSLALRAVAKAMQIYGDEVERLNRQGDLLNTETGYYNSDRDDFAHRVAQSDEAQAAALAEEGRYIQERYSSFNHDIDRYEHQIDTNNNTLRAALNAYATADKARAATSGGDPADVAMQRHGAPGTGATPQEVAAWWNGLSEAERDAVIAANPELIGSADGIPSTARDKANRLSLNIDLAMIEAADGVYTENELAIKRNAEAARDALAAADATTDPIPPHSKAEAFLHLYNPTAFSGDGAVAIAVGNPDTADNVSTFIPGIHSRGDSAGQYTTAAQNIYESARLSDRYGSTSVMMWIGYDAPSDTDLGGTVTEAAAIAGGAALAKHVEGLAAARGDNPPHMTVIGHSYGSTTMAHAASDHAMAADDLVFLGSPGAGGDVHHASDLGDHTVWAGNNSRDLVGTLADDGWVNGSTVNGAGLGRDVGEDTFGANRFQAEDPRRGPTINTDDHLRYWDRGTESVFNIGQIVVGDDSEVVRAAPVHDPWYSGPVDPEWDRAANPLQPGREPDDA